MSACGSSTSIQSRESTLSLAIAEATRCRKCPQKDRAPNHTTPRGCSLLRVKRRTTPGGTGPGRAAVTDQSLRGFRRSPNVPWLLHTGLLVDPAQTM
jgi:hypothetical protein